MHLEIADKMASYFNNSNRTRGANVRVFAHYVDKHTTQENYVAAMKSNKDVDFHVT